MSYRGPKTSNLDPVINYISNGRAYDSTIGWATYADAAGAQPVDGTGGSPNVTWSRDTTTPLRQGADFNFVKDAVNRQGQGVSYDFTIDNADLAKVLTVTFDYEVVSGTLATGDVTVYLIQDPSGTPLVIQPAGYQVQGATVGTKMRQIATFQTSSTVTSYRLCLHVSSVSATAYTLAVDNVVVGPQVVQYGAPVTDWQDKGTITIGATTTAPTKGATKQSDRILMRRTGDTAELLYEYSQSAAGTSGSGSYLFSLPSGMSFDSSKVIYIGTIGGIRQAAATVVGFGVISTDPAAGANANVVLFAYDATRFYAHIDSSQLSNGSGDTGVDESVSSTSYTLNSVSYGFRFTVKAAILGWSSTVQMSNDTDTRVVAARFNTSTARTTNNTAPAIIYDVVQYDTHGAYNSSTGTYVVPVSGQYKVSAFALWSATASTVGHSFSLQLKRNGTFVSNICGTRAQTTALATFDCGGSTTFNFNAGDSLTFGGYSDTASTTIASQPLSNWVCVERISGPSAIAASETVAASYWLSANQAVTADVTPINYDSREFDSHGAVSTGAAWKFSAPISGLYLCTVVHNLTAGAASARIYKNGTVFRYIATTGSSTFGIGSGMIRLNAGDEIQVRSNTTGTLVGGNLSVNGASQIQIVRVGN